MGDRGPPVRGTSPFQCPGSNVVALVEPASEGVAEIAATPSLEGATQQLNQKETSKTGWIFGPQILARRSDLFRPFDEPCLRLNSGPQVGSAQRIHVKTQNLVTCSCRVVDHCQRPERRNSIGGQMVRHICSHIPLSGAPTVCGPQYCARKTSDQASLLMTSLHGAARCEAAQMREW